MLARIYKLFGGSEEVQGANVVELEFLDGRRVQLSSTSDYPYQEEAGLLMLRVWPAGGFEAHGNITDLSLIFYLGDKGVEIRELQTSNFNHRDKEE